MSKRSVEELRSELEEAVLHVRNLTTLLDESPGAEQEEDILDQLQQARARVVEIERELEEAERRG